MNKSNGYILFQDRIRVVIATGFKRASKNVKTGDMIQIWIIRHDVNPIAANERNLDRAICGDCPLKGNSTQPRTCYVLLKNAPLAVFNAFKRGSYPKLSDYSVFAGRSVRFGAYGDPVHIPFPIVQSICKVASNWTGYSHQWRNPVFASYSSVFMASIEKALDQEVARSQGWRTFRVVQNQSERTTGEIACVNESRGVQCADCGLCSGASTRAKSITITVHGNGASNFSAVNN